ncbi:S8 family serine peptidase [Clostridium hydrogeniformans]|uniref:S8 family serine peptidase n=1 Tax=Clostridium hydrogeniformans TaxID=349933 RepID=UPI000487C91B|nr:S8 family serine peptidase [Clostridium hydrogeniformans]
MFSFKSKLHTELIYCIENKLYAKYRVIIKCKKLQEGIEDKLSKYKNAVIHNSNKTLGIIGCTVTPSILERICEYPEVSFICLDDPCFLCATKSYTGSGIKNANRLRLSSKHDLCGRGISIGLIDTGIFPHNDLSNPNKITLFLDLINNYKYPYDDNGHGTFMAGVICGNGKASKGTYEGIAKGGSLCSVKAFNGNGRGFSSDILFAIEYLINESSENNIRILCLPFEILTHNSFILSLFSNILDKALEKDLIPIVPSGSNIGEGSIMGISLLKNCITVSGLDTSKGGYKEYTFSSYGPSNTKEQKPTISAGCNNICSLNTLSSFIPERNGSRLYPPHLEDSYKTLSGTSIACAYASGVFSLILEKKPSLKFKDLLSLSSMGCKDLGLSKNIQGYGVLDLNSILDNL